MTRSIPATSFSQHSFRPRLLAVETLKRPPRRRHRKSPIQRVANPTVAPADSTQLASDNAAFAFDVYKQLITTNTNLIFSPASISIALAMTYAGAAGTTASEMAARFTSPCHPRNCTRRSMPWTWP